jgi:hypothetical protein
MSAQTIADAFAPVEARYHAQVMKETWGHLAPKKNVTYRGSFVLAAGCFGNDSLNPTVIQCEFKDRRGNDLASSPWFYDHLMDFVQDDQSNCFLEGTVHRFDGTFRNYVFEGTFRRLELK